MALGRPLLSAIPRQGLWVGAAFSPILEGAEIVDLILAHLSLSTLPPKAERPPEAQERIKVLSPVKFFPACRAKAAKLGTSRFICERRQYQDSLWFCRHQPSSPHPAKIRPRKSESCPDSAGELSSHLHGR